MSYFFSSLFVLSTPHPMNVGIIPELWLDVKDTARITFNGPDVDDIRSLEGNGYLAAAQNMAQQPEYLVAGLNSRATIDQPNMVGLGLRITGGINIGTNADRTIFMVVKPLSGSFTHSQFMGTAEEQMIDFGEFRDAPNPDVPDRLRVRNGTTSFYTDQGTVPYDTPNIITIIDDSTGTRAWNKDVSIPFNLTVGPGSRAFNWDMSAGSFLGIGRTTSPGNNYKGAWSEVIVYPAALSDEQRVFVLSYLVNKWGF